MKPSVIMDTKYHEEIETLYTDLVLLRMYHEMVDYYNKASHGFQIEDLERIPHSRINDEYKKQGGKHQPLTIGSLKRALIKMYRDPGTGLLLKDDK